MWARLEAYMVHDLSKPNLVRVIGHLGVLGFRVGQSTVHPKSGVQLTEIHSVVCRALTCTVKYMGYIRVGGQKTVPAMGRGVLTEIKTPHAFEWTWVQLSKGM